MALKKMTMFINGAQKSFLCEPDDTLANTLRHMGLTGTKIGCGKGMCGACEVLVDGKIVRSCTKKMSTIPDFSHILTIEGIGTAENMHPLQKAWIAYGGVQCGFCTPGFIMSAYALLKENDNPTRQEVRAWFQKNRNACRCTGYKPLVDAVMAAAKVIRGEWTMKDLEFKMPENGRIYNTRMPRPAAYSKVLGAVDYGDDVAMKTPGMLECAVVQAKVHHANILGIDTSEAEKAPGVIKVVTAKDMPGMNRIFMPVSHPRAKVNGFERPIICDRKVFKYGDVVTVVVADTREHARAAAKLVKLDLEELPAYLSPLDTFKEDFIGIHDGYPAVIEDAPVFYGEDTRDVVAKSAYVAEGSFYAQREPHLTIEPDVSQAFVDDEGVLNIMYKAQALEFGMIVAPCLGLDASKIRVIQNPVGGSFGYSMDAWHMALIGGVSLAVGGRPVNLTLNYEEHTQISGKRVPYYTNGLLACDENGKLTAAEFETLADKGAYTFIADTYLERGLRFFGMPYKIPNAMGWCGVGMSNHSPGIAYRGAGSPQMETASELLMDKLAEQIGMDPLEFRYINVLRDGDRHYNGHDFTVYPMTEILDKMRPMYQAARKRQEEVRDKLPANIRRGVGICCGAFNVGNSPCTVSVELRPDNEINLYNNWPDVGQGGDIGALVDAHEAFKELDLAPEQFHLRMADTRYPSQHGPAAGSRSHYMDGIAVKDGADKLLAAMRKEDGSFRTYDEMVDEGIDTLYMGIGKDKDNTPLDPNTGQGDPTSEYQYGAFLSEVDVDVTTGKTKVVSMHCVVDGGVVGNYLAAEGQAYGGMEHSIGFGLSEEYADPTKDTNLISEGFSYIETIPDGDDFTVDFVQTPRPMNPFGSGGMSEIFQSSDHMAIILGIHDATGAWIYELPARPEKVLAAIKCVEEGKEIPNDRYWFGQDFYEKMDEIKANPIVLEKPLEAGVSLA